MTATSPSWLVASFQLIKDLGETNVIINATDGEIEVVRVSDASDMEERFKAEMREWIEVLRSGKYKQGRGYLNRGGAFCCLGVLGDMQANKHPNDVKWRCSEESEISTLTYKDWTAGSGRLPEGFEEIVGDNGFFPSIGIHYTLENTTSMTLANLASLNDYGVSFKDIANVIEISINGGFVKQ